MGQYYSPVIYNEEDNTFKNYCCYDYGNGAKLMEHSYIGNNFAETVLKQLYKAPRRLAWVGDYAEVDDIKHQLTEAFINASFKRNLRRKPKVINRWESSFPMVYVNYSKKEYINIKKYVLNNGADNWGLIIHPIPLLTAIGNGKGGGDYRGINDNLIGRWACDIIGVVDWLDPKEYPGFKDISEEIKFKE